MKDKKFTEFREKMIACAAEMGVTLEMGSITYGDNSFSFSAKGFNGLEGKREEFERHCAKKDIPSHWFMQRFVVEGVTYEITGIKPRGRKNVLAITNVMTGKSYVCNKMYVTNGKIVPKSNALVNKSGELV